MQIRQSQWRWQSTEYRMKSALLSSISQPSHRQLRTKSQTRPSDSVQESRMSQSTEWFWHLLHSSKCSNTGHDYRRMFAPSHTASSAFVSFFNHQLEFVSSVTECVTLLRVLHYNLRSTGLLAFSLLQISHLFYIECYFWTGSFQHFSDYS